VVSFAFTLLSALRETLCYSQDRRLDGYQKRTGRGDTKNPVIGGNRFPIIESVARHLNNAAHPVHNRIFSMSPSSVLHLIMLDDISAQSTLQCSACLRQIQDAVYSCVRYVPIDMYFRTFTSYFRFSKQRRREGGPHTDMRQDM
jgi:hypothetical protein